MSLFSIYHLFVHTENKILKQDLTVPRNRAQDDGEEKDNEGDSSEQLFGMTEGKGFSPFSY
ncbi:MAG: hypothetical protein ACPLZB_04845 [Caldisericaceae bacterium]